MGEVKNVYYSILVGKPEGGKDHLEDLGINGKILEWIFGK
jgi:hypothetical protein